MAEEKTLAEIYESASNLYGVNRFTHADFLSIERLTFTEKGLSIKFADKSLAIIEPGSTKIKRL